jgi:hypothetical protein
MSFASSINNTKSVSREFILKTIAGEFGAIPTFSAQGTIDDLIYTTAVSVENTALTTVQWVLDNISSGLISDYSIGNNEPIEAVDTISSAFGKVQAQINAISNKDANIIRVSKQGGDFSSVKAAIESITDATSTNKYIVKVGVGIFIEDTIQLKQYVSIVGEDYINTIIEVDDINKDLIIAAPNSSIFNCLLRGSTGVEKSLIVYNGGGLFRVDTVRFGAGYHYMKVGSTSGDTVVHVVRCSAEPITSAVICFEVSDNDVNTVQFFIEYWLQNSSPINEYREFLKAHGTKTTVRLNNVNNISVTASKCINIYNGVDCSISGSAFQGFYYAIDVQNIGTAPKLTITSTAISKSMMFDMMLLHPQLSGSISGNFTKDKVYINDEITNLSLLYNDPTNPGTISLGDLYIGKKAAKLIDAYPILTHSPTLGVFEGGDLTDGTTPLSVTLEAGFGYTSLTSGSTSELIQIKWDTQEVLLSANTTRYIYFNNNGALSLSSSQPNTKTNILLGRVVTNSTSVEFVDTASKIDAYHAGNNIDQFTRSALGAIYESGSTVTGNTNRELSVTAGTYHFGGNKLTSLAVPSPMIFTTYHRSDVAGQWVRGMATVVQNSQYDNGTGTLTNISAGKFARHALYILGAGASSKYMLVYAQQEYNSQVEAEVGYLPTPPSYFVDSVVLIASLIVQEGNNTLINVRDERPVMGFKSSGSSASSSHSNLIGLDSDDHTQYLLVDGTRPMSNSLDMGNNTITNVTSINNVNISTHASRHLPNGTDALATAAPTTTLTVITLNSEGTANSFSRSDHTHAISIGMASDSSVGLLSPTDWNTFNNKANTTVANASTTGLLSSTDWNTFNSKASSTLANGTTTGLLSSTDWNTFNNKAGSTLANGTTTGLLSSTDWNTFNNKAGSTVANGTTTGLLSSTDWNTFNNKASSTVANDTTTGLLSSTDWNTFNNKFNTAGGTITGVTTFSNVTNSTSITTGAVVVTGGLGISLKVNVGSDIEITTSTSGLILRASNGTRYRVTIDTDGALITTAI